MKINVLVYFSHFIARHFWWPEPERFSRSVHKKVNDEIPTPSRLHTIRSLCSICSIWTFWFCPCDTGSYFKCNAQKRFFKKCKKQTYSDKIIENYIFKHFNFHLISIKNTLPCQCRVSCVGSVSACLCWGYSVQYEHSRLRFRVQCRPDGRYDENNLH